MEFTMSSLTVWTVTCLVFTLVSSFIGAVVISAVITSKHFRDQYERKFSKDLKCFVVTKSKREEKNVPDSCPLVYVVPGVVFFLIAVVCFIGFCAGVISMGKEIL